MELVIRKYRSSDRVPVWTLFSEGTMEHVGPCFRRAMSSLSHIGITLALVALGYLLNSVLAAVLFPAAWVGLVYYCSYQVLFTYARVTLFSDMQDITESYLSRPDDCFWVIETEVCGRSMIIGMGAVHGRQNGAERYGELLRMNVSPSFRKRGLGTKMFQTVMDFCKERGFSKVVLETGNFLTAPISFYKKLGFTLILLHTKTACPFWKAYIAKVQVLLMEKHI